LNLKDKGEVKMHELMNRRWMEGRNLAEFDRFLRNVFNSFSDFSPEFMGSHGVPGVQMEADEKEVKAHFPLPGYQADKIHVEVTGNQLTVMAESETYPKEQKGHFLRRERSCRTCTETVRLPGPVHGSETKAEYKNGVLTVTIPRETEAVNHRIVEVK
jgi:HSP20 family protein